MSFTEPIRRSVEVEYWVVDEKGRLTEPAGLVDATAGAEREFVQPMIEIKTSPCRTHAELRTELLDRLWAVVERADKLGLRLVPLATPLAVADDIDDRPSERTRIQDRIIGENFEYVRHCAGTHIHVEKQPGHVLDQFNTLVALDPALALVNSSRHYQGEPLCWGARSQLYRRLAYADLPNQGTLWPYLHEQGTWERRITRCYDQLVDKAVAAGYDRPTVESTFEPETAVWTPVQLREEFPTVEWRSPDTGLPSQLLQLVADVVGTVEHLADATVTVGETAGSLTDETVALPEFDAVCEHVDAAISDGLTDESLRQYLERMGFDTAAYTPLATELPDARISVAEARDLRLTYADRLEHDIRRTRGGVLNA